MLYLLVYFTVQSLPFTFFSVHAHFDSNRSRNHKTPSGAAKSIHSLRTICLLNGERRYDHTPCVTTYFFYCRPSHFAVFTAAFDSVISISMKKRQILMDVSCNSSSGIRLYGLHLVLCDSSSTMSCIHSNQSEMQCWREEVLGRHRVEYLWN